MGAKKPSAPPPTTVLVPYQDYPAASRRYQSQLAEFDKEEAKLRRRAAVNPNEYQAELEGLLAAKDVLVPKPVISGPVPMPDPLFIGQQQRRKTVGRSRTRGGRASTIFTSGLGG